MIEYLLTVPGWYGRENICFAHWITEEDNKITGTTEGEGQQGCSP